MKLASYRARGRASYGLITDSGVIDLLSRFGNRLPTLKAALEAGAMQEVKGHLGQSPTYPLSEIDFLPVIPDAEKIFCVGVNYHAHREETGRPETTHPTLFTRYANTQVGHGHPLIRPRVSKDLDYEAELAVIIGRRARHVPKEKALDYVAGYSCYNEATVRDWQRHTTQFTPGKNFVGTGGFGPWMVTSDEIPDPTQLTLVMRLNGTEMQRSSTDRMIFGIPALIEYLTTFTELVPGDVIATGTPGGVGSRHNPPVFMKAGDVAEVEISRIGILRNPVLDEA